jgi:putative ABC transport system permease protein
MIKDYFVLAEKNLKKRKLRSWLTIIGILISIATIFTLISLSFGLQNAINQQFQQLGTDKFFIMPKGQAGAPGTGGAVSLNETDLRALEKVPGVKAVTYISIGNVKIEYSGKPRFYMAAGIPCDEVSMLSVIQEAANLKLESGVFLERGDILKVVVGSSYSGNQFDKPVVVGSRITLNGVNFNVKGVLKTVGNPSDDKNVYICFNEFETLFNRSNYDEIFVQVLPNEDVKSVAADAEKKLRKERGLTEKTQDFTISTPEELLASFGSILSIVTIFLLGIAAISLVVGGIGIANTMYTSVLERTKEIGVMKAVGAKNSDIIYIFVIESGLLGLIGGVAGVLLGMGVGKLIEIIASAALGTNLLQVVFPLWLILSCLGFAFLVGAFSGMFPALGAARIHPTEALRYE